MPGTNGSAPGETPVTFLEAIKQAMFEEMERDPAVVLLGEDVGVYGGAFKTSEGLLERFGWERVIDTPISESAIIGAACGMSYLGLGESGDVFRAYAGAEGDLSLDAVRREGLAEGRRAGQ